MTLTQGAKHAGQIFALACAVLTHSLQYMRCRQGTITQLGGRLEQPWHSSPPPPLPPPPSDFRPPSCLALIASPSAATNFFFKFSIVWSVRDIDDVITSSRF
eukprot:CAMPEP_0177780326 /NCGR_PEP_ID=MMETSP0491_2-20121128/17133_1 /TAXON_ID=63592 /ORGANISM="Tetraselmis chuii, Strain PLY429" /LENGTH=101 /DNA_ID=CAMNT_0019300069 /DNA_START=80 /DNA_END=385 /DNA_ORIENTATION=-